MLSGSGNISQSNPIPADLKELTSLRFFAALMVFFVHIPKGPEGHPAAPRFLAQLGHSGVDLFFILSGFILMHAYGHQRHGGFSFNTFMQNRLARVMPLHIFMCLLFVVVFGLGPELKGPVATYGVRWDALPWHLLGLHSLGMVKVHAWNFPSWSISAELIAYITFPLALVAVRRLPVWGVLVGSIVATALVDAYVASLGGELFRLTHDFGFLRAVLGFWMGVGLYRIFEIARPTASVGKVLLLASTISLLLLVASETRGALISLALAGIIFGAATLSGEAKSNVLRSLFLVWLGERSYAFYLSHVFVIQIYMNIWSSLSWNWFTYTPVLLFIVSTIIISTALNLAVENPARTQLRRRTKRKFRKIYC